MNQLELIAQVFGTPTEEDIVAALGPEKAEKIAAILQKNPTMGSFDILFPGADPAALDLVKKLMTFNPEKRLTAEEALKHPYLQVLHDPNDEVSFRD